MVLPLVALVLDARGEAIVLVREVVVVLVRPRPLRLLGRELVPLLAGDLAGAASDAQRHIREHRERAGHCYASFRTLQRRAFDSWMNVVGSPRLATRSFVTSP